MHVPLPQQMWAMFGNASTSHPRALSIRTHHHVVSETQGIEPIWAPTWTLSGAPATLSPECKHSHTQVRPPTQQQPHPINAIPSFLDGARLPRHRPNVGDWDHRWARPPSLLSSMPLKQPRCSPPPYPRQTSSLPLAPPTLPYQMASSIEGASPCHPALPHWTTLSLLLPPLHFKQHGCWPVPSPSPRGVASSIIAIPCTLCSATSLDVEHRGCFPRP